MGAYDHLSDDDPRVVGKEKWNQLRELMYDLDYKPSVTLGPPLEAGTVIPYGRWFAWWQNGSWNFLQNWKSTAVKPDTITCLVDDDVRWPDPPKKRRS